MLPEWTSCYRVSREIDVHVPVRYGGGVEKPDVIVVIFVNAKLLFIKLSRHVV